MPASFEQKRKTGPQSRLLSPSNSFRYNESYAYLCDPSHRSDYLDAIKFIRLDTNGDWYLTLGGEIRERYEYYHNNLWGRGPQDDNG